MALTFYGHPFSSYCQKVLIALYEKGLAFDYREINLGDPASAGELEAVWPFKKFPVLADGDTIVAESSIIIEHLDIAHPEPLLIPADPAEALHVRFLDRLFDHHVQTPMQAIVVDAMQPPERKSPDAVAKARATLDIAYGEIERRVAGKQWAAGGAFTLADCSAGPALFYADWVQPITDAFPSVRAYRTRLNARPSFARAIDEARPWRQYFPPGAPDRD